MEDSQSSRGLKDPTKSTVIWNLRPRYRGWLGGGGFVGGQSAPRQEPLSSQREDSLRGPAIHRPVEGQEVPREGVATVQGVLLPCICILDAGEAGSTAEFACQGHSACNCLLVAAEGHSVLDAVPDFEGLVSEALRF